MEPVKETASALPVACSASSTTPKMEAESRSDAYASLYYVRFEVFTAVTMKNRVFWDVTPYGSCKNRRFRGT
jgi:hypothetical protein